MRDEIKQWGKTRTQTGGTLTLPGGHSELASSLLTVLHADLYSENFYTVESRLLAYKQKGTLENGEMAAARARCPVASVVSGKVGRVSGGRNRTIPGVPSPADTGTLHIISRVGMFKGRADSP